MQLFVSFRLYPSGQTVRNLVEEEGEREREREEGVRIGGRESECVRESETKE
jgi:hypothetical protein